MECNDRRNLQLNFYNLLMFSAIALIPMQDFILYDTPLHMFGRMMTNIPLSLLIVYFIFSWIGRKNKICIVNKRYIIFGIYFVVLSLIMGEWTNTDMAFTVKKTFTQGIMFLYWIIFYENVKRYRYVNSAVKAALVINLIGFIACDIGGMFGNSVFHVDVYPDSRYRGFTAEASWFCFTSVILGLLTFDNVRGGFCKFLIIISTLYILFTGGSKGILICAFLAMIIYICCFARISMFYKLLTFFITISIAFIVADVYLMNAFLLDLSEATSFATRASLDIAYIMTFINYPLGVGVGGAITIVSQYALPSFDYLQGVVPIIVLKDVELLASVSRTDGSGVLIANMFFIMLCYFGVPFLLLFIKYVRKVRKFFLEHDNGVLTYLIILVLIGNMTYVSFGYDSILIFSLVAKEKKWREQMKSE